MISPFESRKQKLYFILFGIFVSNALIAEIIGAKIFSVEKTFGLSPAEILTFWGERWSFNQPAGAISWPLVFLTSDIINEYFGKKGVQIISYFTAALILGSFFFIYIATVLPPAQFWIDNNKISPNYTINDAFQTVFRQGMGIIIGSLTAFLGSQLIDAIIFHKIKSITKGNKIWMRATGSTLVSQLIDSFVVIFIAFFVFGNWSFGQVISVALNSYVYKFVIAILLTPVIYIAHYQIDKFLKIN